MPDPVAVNSMFARIARRYDVANRLLSGGIDIFWRKRLVKEVKKIGPKRILDLATGSGDVAFALARALPDAEIVGMDFCQPMLDEAELKKVEKGGVPNVSFRQGDGLALPCESSSFSAVTVSFGLRNMADRPRALSEMARVLGPAGSLYVLEFSQPYRWFCPFYFFYLRSVVPTLAAWITGDRAAYEYLNATIEEFPGREELASELGAAGFQQIRSFALTFGIVALHVATK